MSDIILDVAQGLGDSLAKSTIPELIVRNLHKNVLIREPHWRNLDIKRLWERNPFVSGFTNESPNFITSLEITSQCLKYDNLIKAMEACYGFEPENSYPKLYNVNYRYIKELAGKTLIEPKSVAVNYTQEAFLKFLNRLKDFGIYHPNNAYLVEPTYNTNVNNEGASEDLSLAHPKYQINDIFDYINAIFSCENFICVTTGVTILAGAIKRDGSFPKIYSLISNGQYNQGIWLPPGVNKYIVDSTSYDDYKVF